MAADKINRDTKWWATQIKNAENATKRVEAAAELSEAQYYKDKQDADAAHSKWLSSTPLGGNFFDEDASAFLSASNKCEASRKQACDLAKESYRLSLIEEQIKIDAADFAIALSSDILGKNKDDLSACSEQAEKLERRKQQWDLKKVEYAKHVELATEMGILSIGGSVAPLTLPPTTAS